MRIAIVLFMLAALALPAQAGSMMSTGGTVSAGVLAGWASFCNRHPADCHKRTIPARIKFTAERQRQLADVLRRLQTIPQRSDEECYGQAEYFAYPGTCGGDCDDLALQAQKWLEEKGWPAGALLLTVAWDIVNAEYHYVLTIDTIDGTYVLDNNTLSSIHLWDERVLYYVMRQSSSGRNTWVKVIDNHNPPELVPEAVLTVVSAR